MEIRTHNSNGGLLEYKHFFFGGGEQHVQIEHKLPMANLFMQYGSDTEIVKLHLIVDALRRQKCTAISLDLPYFPAARQDRVCNPGEPLSVKVYANLINMLELNRVKVFDPHSDVTAALLNNVTVVDNCEFVGDAIEVISQSQLGGVKSDQLVIVSPDAGSNKKVNTVAKYLTHAYGPVTVVRADKLRDVRTGSIIETTVYADDLTGKTCVIVDDICSKGGTFCALAKVLKNKGASSVNLVVSHYEGTATARTLRDSGIDRVITTNSKWFQMSEEDQNLIHVLDVRQYLK